MQNVSPLLGSRIAHRIENEVDVYVRPAAVGGHHDWEACLIGVCPDCNNRKRKNRS